MKERGIWKIKEVKTEIKLWNDLKRHIAKKMKGKTYTKDLEKEVNYMLKERSSYLKRLRGIIRKI